MSKSYHEHHRPALPPHLQQPSSHHQQPYNNPNPNTSNTSQQQQQQRIYPTSTTTATNNYHLHHHRRSGSSGSSPRDSTEESSTETGQRSSSPSPGPIRASITQPLASSPEPAATSSSTMMSHYPAGLLAGFDPMRSLFGMRHLADNGHHSAAAMDSLGPKNYTRASSSMNGQSNGHTTDSNGTNGSTNLDLTGMASKPMPNHSSSSTSNHNNHNNNNNNNNNSNNNNNHNHHPSQHDKDFLCELCGKKFTQKGNLKTHIRSVHTKEKPFSCPVCGKCFSQKGNMQTHVRTHNKDDRFPCHLCGKTFSQKGNLKTHIQRHSGTLPPSKRPTSRRRASNHSNSMQSQQQQQPGAYNLGVGSSVDGRPPSGRSSLESDDEASSSSDQHSGGSGLGPQGRALAQLGLGQGGQGGQQTSPTTDMFTARALYGSSPMNPMAAHAGSGWFKPTPTSSSNSGGGNTARSNATLTNGSNGTASNGATNGQNGLSTSSTNGHHYHDHPAFSGLSAPHHYGSPFAAASSLSRLGLFGMAAHSSMLESMMNGGGCAGDGGQLNGDKLRGELSLEDRIRQSANDKEDRLSPVPLITRGHEPKW